MDALCDKGPTDCRGLRCESLHSWSNSPAAITVTNIGTGPPRVPVRRPRCLLLARASLQPDHQHALTSYLPDTEPQGSSLRGVLLRDERNGPSIVRGFVDAVLRRGGPDLATVIAPSLQTHVRSVPDRPDHRPQTSGAAVTLSGSANVHHRCDQVVRSLASLIGTREAIGPVGEMPDRRHGPRTGFIHRARWHFPPDVRRAGSWGVALRSKMCRIPNPDLPKRFRILLSSRATKRYSRSHRGRDRCR